VGEDDSAYRFEAPEHEAETFDDPEDGELYANIYFDVNGFEEAGIGERGVPPVIIRAGRDTLAAYFLTHDTIDEHWVGSFRGSSPGRYCGTPRGCRTARRTSESG